MLGVRLVFAVLQYSHAFHHGSAVPGIPHLVSQKIKSQFGGVEGLLAVVARPRQSAEQPYCPRLRDNHFGARASRLAPGTEVDDVPAVYAIKTLVVPEGDDILFESLSYSLLHLRAVKIHNLPLPAIIQDSHDDCS